MHLHKNICIFIFYKCASTQDKKFTGMNKKKIKHEYKCQWAKVYERREHIKCNYVPLVEYWLDGIGLKAKKTTIRHVLHHATYDWIVLMLLGKLVGYNVILPAELEITKEMKSIIEFEPQPKIK